MANRDDSKKVAAPKAAPALDKKPLPEKPLTQDQKYRKEDENFRKEKERLKAKYAGESINVVALRDGFYNQRRIDEGMKFTIENVEHFGKWMKEIL